MRLNLRSAFNSNLKSSLLSAEAADKLSLAH